MNVLRSILFLSMVKFKCNMLYLFGREDERNGRKNFYGQTWQSNRASFAGCFGRCLYKKIIEITSGYKKKWIFTKSGGWMLKAFDAKKALFYIIPLKNELKISMAIRENERDLFLKEECIHIYHDRLLSAKKFTEGYAVQFMIADEFDFTGVESLLRILMSLRS